MSSVPPPKTKRSFDESSFPARPGRVQTRLRKKRRPRSVSHDGPATVANAKYLRWLRSESMLTTANQQARHYSGQGKMWQNPFARPQPRAAVNLASVWYTAYPISMITEPDTSILATLGHEELWKAFRRIGIKAVHTGPVKRAGGLSGWDATPSVDGHFDRISTRLDPVFGTEAEFEHLAGVAAAYGGIVIDDIIPGHTGKGADFRLAEMNCGEYPGIYHLVEIDREDWEILPEVPRGQDSVNINVETEEALKKRRYIIGRLPRVIFYEPGVKETNWSVTRPVKGVDGVTRRWVYLHYFKGGQPSINWLDPSFAGMKLVIGDALHSIGDLGSTGLRLDANGFLGIERSDEEAPAWSEGHPLSEAANQLIAGMVRKMGGFTFQELNLAIDDIKVMSTDGADLSYDFVNRPAYHHALATGDTEFLQLTLRQSLELGVDPASLVHALQNHDELTYELVHFWTTHKDDTYRFRGEDMKGSEIRRHVRRDLKAALTGASAPYNLLFTENGVACTAASAVAAILGIQNLAELRPEEIERIKDAHLLLAMFNALQPGVFALSGWDLVGALTLQAGEVADLLREGDTRWINRGAFDLMGENPETDRSMLGMPKATALYGTLLDQLADPDSFASRLRQILTVRERYGVATGEQLDVPDVEPAGLLVMVHRLAGMRRLTGRTTLQVTALNFSQNPIETRVVSSELPARAILTNMFTDQRESTVDARHGFPVALGPHQGMSFLVTSS